MSPRTLKAEGLKGSAEQSAPGPTSPLAATGAALLVTEQCWASEVLTLLNSSSQMERLPGTRVVVSHPKAEDHQMNATRVPCQVQQEMMAFLNELARLRSVV